MKKIITAITLFVFCITFVLTDAWAAMDLDRAPYGIPVAPPAYGQFAVLDTNTFAIPAHLGEVKYSFNGTSNKVVIHIQDAHCNYYAQCKISDIIDYLSNEYGVRVINLEGGVGKYDLTVFTAISGEAIRREVADYFVKQGEINGAEFYAVNNPDKMMLWGVEDKDLYLANLQVYRDSLEYKPEVDKFLESLTHILNNLKRHIYTPELLKIDMAYSAYKAGNMDLREYLEFLVARAREEGIEVKNFTNLYLLVQAMQQEGKIDFEKANTERNIVIDELKNSLSKVEITELVAKSVDFKTKKISRKIFYDYLLDKAKETGLEINRFPELSNYIVYVTIYEAVNRFSVMEELDKLEIEIKQPLYRNDTERRLNILSRNLALMKNIFNISLTKTDYEYYLTQKSSFEITNYIDFIEKEAPKYKIDARPSASIMMLDDYREKIVRFYEYSFERDEVFIKNLKFHPEREGIRSAVLMTGGFHTENLCNLFKSRNISYVSILPKFISEKGYECPYFDILAGQTTNIQRMLSSVLAKTAMLQIASKLSSLGEEIWGKANIDVFKAAVFVQEQIARGRGIVDITKDGDDVVFYMKDESEIRMPIRALLDAVHQREIDAQMERLAEEDFEDIEDIDVIIDELKKFLAALGAEEDVLGRVEDLKGDNADGKALVRFVLADLTFRGHAGGQGIRINGNLKGSDTEAKAAIIHEIIAGLFGDHFIAQRVEDAFLANDTSEKVLSGVPRFDMFIWAMTPEERLTVDRDFIEEEPLALAVPEEARAAGGIIARAYKALTTNPTVEYAVPEKYALHKAIRELEGGKNVIVVTAETSALRDLNEEYGHTNVDFLRDEFGKASFEYISENEARLAGIDIGFITFYNPYGGRWQYIFTAGEDYDKEAFEAFLNELLETSLSSVRSTAGKTGFERPGMFNVIMSASKPATREADLAVSEDFLAKKQQIILDKLFAVKRAKRLPEGTSEWLARKTKSPPQEIITELDEYKEYFNISSVEQFEREIAFLAQSEYYKDLIKNIIHASRNLIVYAENEYLASAYMPWASREIREDSTKNPEELSILNTMPEREIKRVFFDDIDTESWIKIAKTRDAAESPFAYFGIPKRIPDYSKIENELQELENKIGTNPQGEELKALLEEAEKFAANALSISFETEYGVPAGISVVNTLIKRFSQTMAGTGEGIVFRINADFDFLSQTPVDIGDVIKIRGIPIIKEEFEKAFIDKEVSTAVTVQKGMGDELVVIGYFKGESKDLRGILENAFKNIEDRLKTIEFDGQPITYRVIDNGIERMWSPSISAGVSFISDIEDEEIIREETELLDTKAEEAVQYSKDTGRAGLSFYEDVPDKAAELDRIKLEPYIEDDLFQRIPFTPGLLAKLTQIPGWQVNYFDFLRKFIKEGDFIDVAPADNIFLQDRIDRLLRQMGNWFGVNEENWEEGLDEVRKRSGVYLGTGYGGQNLSRICKGNFGLAVIIDKNPFVTEIFMPIRAALMSMAGTRAEYLALLAGVRFSREELEELRPETLENIHAAINKKIKTTDIRDISARKQEIWLRTEAQLPEEIRELAKDFWDVYSPRSFYMEKMLKTMEGRDSWLASEDNFYGIKKMTEEGRILGITGDWLSRDIGDKLKTELMDRNLEVSVIYISNILEWIKRAGIDIETAAQPAIPLKDEVLVIKDRLGKTEVTDYEKGDFIDAAKGLLSFDVGKVPVEADREEILSRVKQMTLEKLERIIIETPEAEKDSIFYRTALLEIEGRQAKNLLSMVRPGIPYAILMPLTEDQMLMEWSKHQDVAGSARRIIEKKYGTNTRVFYYARGNAESLNDAREKALRTQEFRRDDRALVLAYVTPDMSENDIAEFGIADRVAGVVKEEIEEDQRLDEVLHVILGIGLIDYVRTRRDDIKERITNLLNIMVKDMDSLKGMSMEALLKGAFLLRIKRIDYGEIDDWKEAQDAILIAL